MPTRPLPYRCWILTVTHDCTGDDADWHSGGEDVSPLLPGVAELWAARPDRMPPVPWRHDTGCLVVDCRVCGMQVGDGEHFADAEHALEAAECDGWQDDVCPFCQPVEVPS